MRLLYSVLSGQFWSGNKLSTAAVAEPAWKRLFIIVVSTHKRALLARCSAFSKVQGFANQLVETAIVFGITIKLKRKIESKKTDKNFWNKGIFFIFIK